MRLQVSELERTCARLEKLGFARPLLDVSLRREGRAVIAEVDGVTFRPVKGFTRLSVIRGRDSHENGSVHLSRHESCGVGRIPARLRPAAG